MGFRFCGRCGARVGTAGSAAGSSWWTGIENDAPERRRGRAVGHARVGPEPSVAIAALGVVVLLTGLWQAVTMHVRHAPLAAEEVADPGRTGSVAAHLDLGDEMLWQIDAAALGGEVPEASGTWARGDGVVVANAEGAVAGWVDGTGGDPTWRAELPVHPHVAPALDGGDVVVAATDSVWMLDAARGLLRWRTELFDDPASTAAFVEDVVVLTTTAGGLEALDRRTGVERWRVRGRDLGGDVTYRFDVGAAAGPDGSVVALGVDRSTGRLAVHVIDATSGQLLVRSEPVLRSSRHAIVGSLLIGGAEQWATAIDLRTGAVVWRTSIGEVGRFPQPLAERDGRVLVVAGTDTVVLDASNGAHLDVDPAELSELVAREASPAGPVVPDRACPVATGPDLVVATNGEQLEAFGPSDGRRRWSHRPLSGTAGAPSVVAGDVLLTDRGGNLVVLDADTGLERIVGVAGSDPIGGAAATPDGALLVAAGGTDVSLGGAQMSGYVRILDARTGTPAWLRWVHGPLRQPPTVGDDRVIVGTVTGEVQRLDLTTGEIEWTHHGAQPVTAPVALHGHRTVVATATRVTVLADDGAAVWSVDLGLPVRRAVAVDDELVVTRGRHGEVVARDLRTGAQRWRTDLEVAITGAPVIAGDTVLVGSALGVEVLDRRDGRPQRRLSTTSAVIDRVRITASAIVACTADGTLVALGHRP